MKSAFPKEPAGGEVSVTHLHAGGEAYFKCFTGYKLQGPKMLMCRNATTPYWSGKEPRCVGKTNQFFGETHLLLLILQQQNRSDSIYTKLNI